MRRLFDFLLALAAGFVAHSAEARPERIVSLNLCADQLLLEMVEPARIGSVTWLARDATQSAMAERARGVPINYGRAEEIVPQRADLVLVGQFTAPAATAMLRRLGLRVETVGHPRDLAGVKAEILRVGLILDEGAKAQAIVATIDRRLSGLPEAAEPRPVAALLRPNGVTAGPGSLVDDVLRAAGYVNFSASIGRDRLDRLPLEALILGRPDVLVVDQRDFAAPSLAQAMQRAPVLAHVAPKRVVVPSWSWTCAGSAIAEAVERLAAARL